MILNVNMQEEDVSIPVVEQNDTLSGGMSDIQTVTPPPMDSPVFTGVPIAPTAPTGTRTTQIATTEFVKREIDLAHMGYGNIVYMTVSEVTL